MANLDYGIPITPENVFRIGSVSKHFAAMAIALAAEEGKLSLDDDVRKYIPELPKFSPPVTIRHVLMHLQWEGQRHFEYERVRIRVGEDGKLLLAVFDSRLRRESSAISAERDERGTSNS